MSDEIQIPWVDSRHVDETLKTLTARGERKIFQDLGGYQKKIKPLMIGARRLSHGISYRKLRKGYERYIRDRRLEKPMQLMCYFGNPKGPRSETDVVKPDFDWEGDVMGYFGDHVSHPNEKRARIAEYISRIKYCDARVIGTTFSDSGGEKDKSKIVPLPEWCAYVAKFRYNFNVSVY